MDGTTQDRCGRCGQTIVVPEADRTASGSPAVVEAPPPPARRESASAPRGAATFSGWSQVEQGLGLCVDAVWLASFALMFFVATIVAALTGSAYLWWWGVVLEEARATVARG